MSKALSRILYVEDEPILRKLMAVTLEKMGGFTVEIVASGSAALEVVERFCPDLILLDVMMPEMDGPETLKRLRELPNIDRIPTVFITAKAQPQEIARFQALDVAGVLTKPFDPATLCSDLRMIWSEWDADMNGTANER